ncbi:hypothetical protein PNEG_00843 [Pneumocystis murina B123]|uniref:Uncharacterized protein n=1 Tax=Pneumocystis murina (strain B123) TaxID=1069680 RepID=M7NTU4_PNEMU|nr:hypothetical protein PNEG_00843 [Pneumocystis murina B123]EMR10692.1 hypothetical protein PNEG_00843 [Pneumocystis murina B123]
MSLKDKLRMTLITSKRKRSSEIQISKPIKKTFVKSTIDVPIKRAVLKGPDAFIHKRSIPHPVDVSNKIFISRKTLLMNVIKKIKQKLMSFNSKSKPIILYAQSAAIERALEIALVLSLQIPLDIQIQTGTIEIVDDVLPYDMDKMITSQIRLNSTVQVIISLLDQP